MPHASQHRSDYNSVMNILSAGHIQLRRLVNLRALAIFAQLLTLLAVWRVLELELAWLPMLFTIGALVSALRSELDVEALLEAVDEIEVTAADARRELRETLLHLNDDSDDLAFHLQLDGELRLFESVSGCMVRVTRRGLSRQMPRHIERLLIDAAVEGARNAVKHGSAELVAVDITYEAAQVCLLDEESFGRIDKGLERAVLRFKTDAQCFIARDDLLDSRGDQSRIMAEFPDHADIERNRLSLFRATRKSPPHLLRHRWRERAAQAAGPAQAACRIARLKVSDQSAAAGAQGVLVGVRQGAFGGAIAKLAIRQRQDNAPAFQFGDHPCDGHEARHAPDGCI